MLPTSFNKTRAFVLPLVAAFIAAPAHAEDSDIDCEIMFCLAAGFGHSSCADAYSEMIDNVTPWPVKPPFGICTLSNLDGSDAGPMDTAVPEMEYLQSTRVLWWDHKYTNRTEEGPEHTWELSSCLTDNNTCRIITEQTAPRSDRPDFPYTSQNGGDLTPPFNSRAFAIEYVDYEGTLYQTEWTTY